MYLEKIEIFGFKSFADKVVIHFNQPITSIVGPNGCGKSNVVDAFRWVLGEGSAKSLRSDKMTDVIFSGTSKRKPLNYAQIALTFSKVKNSLSLGFDELCIARRLHRNGESQWLINRNPVRLKDVHKVLWEAGMGKNAFYIFEQGKVDQLITSTPLERRVIFEEAAKIMLFKEKKREALRKLGHVEENLKRVLDIQSEVEKQIQRLSLQAEEAKIYTENQAKLKELEEGLFIAKWKHFHKKLAHEKEKQAENVDAQKQQNTDLSEKEAALEALKHSKEKLALETKRTYALFFEEKKAKELALFECNIHQKKIQELDSSISSLKDQLKKSHQNHLLDQKTFQENEIHLQEEKKELATLSHSLTMLNKSLSSLEHSVEEQSFDRKEAQKKLLSFLQNENEAEAESKKVLSTLQLQEEKLNQILQSEKNHTHELTTLKHKSTDYEQKLKTLQTQYEEAQKNFSKLQHELQQEEQRLKKLQNDHEQLFKELSETKASKAVLHQLKEEMEGYSKTTQKLLKEAKNSHHPLFEKIFLLTDWFKPKKGNEQKISTLLQPFLQSLVVPTHLDLKVLFELAKKEDLSSFSCLCLEDLSEPPEHADLQLAELNKVSWHFLSHLQAKGDFSSAFKEGYYLDHLGVYHFTSKDEQNVFLRALELEEKENLFASLEAKNQKLTASLQEVKSKLKTLDHQKNKESLALRDLEIEKHRLQDQSLYCHQQKESLSEKIQKYQDHKKELEVSLSELRRHQKNLSLLLEEKKSHRQNQEQTFSKIESQFEENFSDLKEKRSLKQNLEEKIKQTEKRSQNLKESIRVFESKSSHFEEEVEKISAAIEEKERALDDLKTQSQSLEKKSKDKETLLFQAEEIYKKNEKDLEHLESEQKKLDLGLKQARESLNVLRNIELEITSKLSEFQAQISLLTEEVSDKLNLTIEEIENKPLPPSITLGQTEREIKKLRNALLEQPQVNLKALSECEAEKSRFEFLQSQIEDLNVSQEELLKIITDLDDSSRRKFEQTFEQIREKFKTNFSLLFNGGEADLQLAPHEDLLEAGIEIIAQPPGKKMRSIQLLSGGEKCLCAIALLFALFETQSIPFCILDEIDAPLDDTNIERFTNVLKKFVQNHQFIIITHNKRTMAISDQLLGISMQEKGVTQVLPLKFAHKPSEELANI